MIIFGYNSLGADGVPENGWQTLSVTDSYHMAVLRLPPRNFSVEMLSPTKHGGEFYYGMLISPVKSDDASDFSSPSNSPTEIWRRWSDCLRFQEALEVEYGRMTSKKQGSKARHSQASPLEHLPNDSNFNSVDLNIHHYLPKLTKKDTVFWDSPTTVNRRYMELKDLIERLFSSDAPPLLLKLRQDRSTTRFFAFWRIDHEFAHTLTQKRLANPRGRASGSRNILFSYFSSTRPDRLYSITPGSVLASTSTVDSATSTTIGSTTTLASTTSTLTPSSRRH